MLRGDTVGRKRIDVDLTPSESEIMEVLLEEVRPITSGDLIELSPHRSWANRSIYVLLNNLMRKNLIEPVGYVRVGRTKGRLFQAKISKEEFSTLKHISYLSKAKEGSIGSFMSALSHVHRDDDDLFLEELHEWLDNYENASHEE